MQLTILIENTTNVRGLKAEPGLSIYLEEGPTKILLDTGASSLFLENAATLGIDLLDLDIVVLSHGHYDHTGGLAPLLNQYRTRNTVKKPSLYTHPLAFHRRVKQGREMGCSVSKEELSTYLPVHTSSTPVWLTNRLVFLGEIPRTSSFEGTQTLGKIFCNGKEEDDFVADDSALVYTSGKGLVIITGCSHSGISNIMEYAKTVCNNTSIFAIIGGLHLRQPSPEVFQATCAYLEKNQISELYPCHCTDFFSRLGLTQLNNLREASTGLTLQFP